MPKQNQSAQFAVLDMPLNGAALEQCADVIMHLRTAYLLSVQQQGLIRFTDNNGHAYLPPDKMDGHQLRNYLTTVYAHCGTASLEKQLRPVRYASLQAGDVLVQGGSPGHAMLIADMAVDKSGHAVFLLLQGYMPAQDMHIVVNPLEPALSPWYRLDQTPIETPEWTFRSDALHSW